MTKKVFRSTIFVAAVVLLCSLGIILGALYSHFNGIWLTQLRDELRIAAAGTQLEGVRFLESLEADTYRVTWVAADGTVLYDTAADATVMENHADREEIREALATGSGSASRTSATSLSRTSYEAMLLDDGSVLRISAAQQTMLILLAGILHPMGLVIIIAILLSAFLAHRMSKKIVEPLNTLDLENPLQNDVYEEITPLLQRINQQHLQISAQLKTLRYKTHEFEQITGHMREGLVLLDSEGTVLSINPTARALFSAPMDCVGRSFFAVDRSAELRSAINKALDSGHSTVRIERVGREYQLDLSRIQSEEHPIGAVILAFDVTEANAAERSRREFSANVSHELKTPLQSIMGSAELLETGMVKAEDTPRFVGHIRKEARRLVDLVEDIIRLSQLDEEVPLPTEEVDLLALARETAATLKEAAQAKGVSVRVTGEGCTVTGVRRLLYEILYNLCDNAIKYNRDQGSVVVQVTPGRFTVTDTGIGIPPEHQSRVFERFYRVDKSHSKASGGTGLGLSIVKHAVQYHNAALELESTPGEGTSITVIF